MNPLTWRRVRRLIIFTGAFLFSVGLVERSGADVGPADDWVGTGPPASPVSSSLGTLVTLPDGTALLIGQAVQQYVPSTGTWAPAGSLLGSGGVPTVLSNGKVLVTGLSPAEVYDPATQTSTLTGAMIIPRTGHQATLLASEVVLISGGADANGQLVGPAEVYHPEAGTWHLTGTMNNPRRGHTAILLNMGKVLVAGGSAVSAALTSAELFDPGTGIWMFTASNSVGGAVSTLLTSGKVLVVGGIRGQLFDPSTESWSTPIVVPGVDPVFNWPGALARLNDGRALLVELSGGSRCPGSPAAIFDPVAAAWVLSAHLVGDTVSLVVLADGRGLAATGRLGGTVCPVAAAYLFRTDNTTARLALTPPTLDFGNVAIGVPAQLTAIVQNTGQAQLNGSVTVSNSPGFSLISGAAYSLGAGASSSTVVGFSSSTLGAFTGTATFMSNGGWASVPLTASVGIMLSGRIFQTGGAGVPSVPVELHGTSSGSTTTDANGAYSFFVQPGTYTVVPASPSLTFTPPSRTVTISTANATGLDFEVVTVLYAAVLPSSRSVQVGISATAFATLINASPAAATGCGISPLTSVPATFLYQTTNPSTNAVMGTPNTPVIIPAGGAQTYVVALTPTGPFPPTDVQLSFDCTNTNPAPVTSGVNTLLLSASVSPTPDIVALAATLNSDGIVNIPGTTGTGVFAVATVNVGAGGSITASADTGGVTLPLTISLCQTNPATGQCISAIGPTVTTQINIGETPTFGIFVMGTGPVAFDPANNRVFARFKDGGNVTRGLTSVAVRTQ